jgi:hypothetical protein
MDIVESCSEKLYASLETTRACSKIQIKSEIYIAYPRIVNNQVFLQKSHFVLSVCLQFFPGHIFWIKQLNSFWSNKDVEKAMPSLSGADAQLPHSARKKCPREMPSTGCLCPLDPPTVP